MLIVAFVPSTLIRTDIDYNNAQCAGQNGVTNAAARPGGAAYSGGVLTTTGGAAAGQTSSSAAAAPDT